jgi:hypothetical protein
VIRITLKHLIFLTLGLLSTAPAVWAQTTPCASPESRQFDFWVGNWDLSWQNAAGKEFHGKNNIVSMWGACGVEENFSGQPGPQQLLGNSVSMYSPATSTWRQTWVDNSGSYLEFEGGMEEDSMVLYGHGTNPATGDEFRTRMRFFNITEDAFEWNWERSVDDGASWQLSWAIHYQRAASGR